MFDKKIWIVINSIQIQIQNNSEFCEKLLNRNKTTANVFLNV